MAVVVTINPFAFASLGRPTLPSSAKRARTPLHVRSSYDQMQALQTMGFLREGRLWRSAAYALEDFAAAFVFPHIGATFRRPKREQRDKAVEAARQGESPTIAYAAKRKSDHCYMSAKRSDLYRAKLYQEKRAAIQARAPRGAKIDYKAIRGFRLDRGVLNRLAAEHPCSLAWPDLYRHLLGDAGGAQHLQWTYLVASADTMHHYVVLDLDDKVAPCVWPTTPSRTIKDALRFLSVTGVFDPCRAVMFSSPGGRGRHLYYFLDRSVQAAELARAVDRFLRWQWERHTGTTVPADGHVGVPGIDVFPTGAHRSTQAALPLGRGSVLCSPDGMPLPRGSVLDNLQAVAAAVEDARTRALSMAEMATPATWTPQPFPVMPEEEGDCADLPSPDGHDDAGKEVPSEHDGEDEVSTPASPTALDLSPLTGPGQRYRRCMAILRAHRELGTPRNDAIRATQDWLEAHHGGHSATYNDDPAGALDLIVTYAASVYQDHRPEDLRLDAAQTAFIVDAILAGIHAKRLRLAVPSPQLHHLLVFAGHFIAQITAFAEAHGDDDDANADHRRAAVSHRILDGFPYGTKRVRPTWMGMLQKMKLVTKTRCAAEGVCREFAIHNAFPKRQGTGMPVEEALITYLSVNGRWRRVCSAKSWQRWRSARLDITTCRKAG